MIKLLNQFRKKKALRSYIQKLPKLLRKDYGLSERYTTGQVRRSIDRYGLNQNYMIYAYAMFTGKNDFINELGSDGYELIRQEIADAYFNGDAEFVISESRGGSSSNGGGVGSIDLND